MKALILAGGRGKRIGSVTEVVNKCFLEVSGKPLIEYSLNAAANLKEIDKIILLVGYKAEDIIKRFGESYQGKPVIYIKQEEQLGLVHAIECAKDALGKDDFMLMLGDEVMINARHKEFIQEFISSKVFALCGVLKVTDRNLIKKTYTIFTDNDARIWRLVEKPRNPINDFMGTGNCIFKNAILDYIKHTPINQQRMQKELPDLIQCAIDDGKVVKPFVICSDYINVNYKDELDKTRSYFEHL
ncbi:MAG: nucleotidyltransferase family protein [Candidatus Omnitrophota bacterium]